MSKAVKCVLEITKRENQVLQGLKIFPIIFYSLVTMSLKLFLLKDIQNKGKKLS